MIRKSILIAAAAATIGSLSTPALAKDTPKGKFTKDGAEGYCNAKEGSTFWATPDGMNYGCGYKGGGGLMCDKETGCLESDGKADRREVPWDFAGLLGLIGLVGLVGLQRRDGVAGRS